MTDAVEGWLDELPARFRFAWGSVDIHEWCLEAETEVVIFRSDAGPFSAIKSLSEFFEAVVPEDREAVRRIIKRMLTSAQPCHYECRIALPGGDIRWIAVTGRSVGSADAISRFYGFTQDITERRRAEAVTFSQNHALQLALDGALLVDILSQLAIGAEEQVGEGILASFLLFDDDGVHVRRGAAPSLPIAYQHSVVGLALGPKSGATSSAAFFGEPTIFTDISQDPRWDGLRHLVQPYGFLSCWSIPVLCVDGEVLGAMVLYGPTVREPNRQELEAMSSLVNTASLIIGRYREANEKNKVEQRFRSLVNATNAVVWTTTTKVEVVSHHPGWATFTGQTTEEMLGTGWMQAIHPDDAAILASALEKMRTAPLPVQAELRLRRADGQYREMIVHAVPIFDAKGSHYEWAGSYTDITERKEAEKRLHHLAMHDPLTGLPNRAFLNKHLPELLELAPDGQSVAVMMIDLDRFKQVNDSMGHGPGDVLLCNIAERFKTVLRSSDLVARLGGDEFVVVAHVKEGRASAEVLADKLVKEASLPMEVLGSRLISGASIGVTLYPEDGHVKDLLIQHADIAMYQAKREGGTRYRFFSAEMSVETKNRMALEIALRGALERQEFVLHYQPRISLADDRPLGVEALIRWIHPERGLVSPLDFIPIAEEIGLIDEIGLWALRCACADIHALNVRLGSALRLSVNLSPRQLTSPDLTRQVLQALEEAGMRPDLLELELTEGAFIHDLQASARAMHELKALGVQLAVDDFGTGHAGISYLRHFPFDVLKLDRTFVMPESMGSHGYGFIKAVTEMAHTLGLYVVAEGVEDSDTLAMLKQSMCDEAQGYLFARPLPLTELEQYFLLGKSL